MEKKRQVHEPKAMLADAEDAIADADRLQRLRESGQRPSGIVSVRISLAALLEAMDSLDAPELRQVQRHVAERLAEVGAQS